MPHLFQDLRIAFRSLRKAPLTMTVTVVSLGLGIGAVTAVFTLANTLLFIPPGGLSEPEGLVTLYTSREDGRLYGRVSFPDYEDLLAADSALSDAAAYLHTPLTLGEGSGSQALLGEAVTVNYFAVLGIRAAIGRTFLPGETADGGDPRVAVISHDLWQQRFSGTYETVGRTILLAGQPYTVVGVAAADTRLTPLLATEVWVPLETSKGSSVLSAEDLERRDLRRFNVIGRLRPDASLAHLQSQLAVLAERLHQDHGEAWEDDLGKARALSALAMQEARMNPDRQPVLAVLGAFLFGATGLILLIACSNVASLFLARAHQRRRETAVRIALGASRSRLVAMALTESLMAALASAGVGLALAGLAARALGSLPTPAYIPLSLDFQLDHRVLTFAMLLAVGTSLTFGLAPALRESRPNLVPSLKSDSTSSGRRPGRFGLRNLLVVAQVAASLVLLVGAGLFLRSLQGATMSHFGLDPQRIALMTTTLPAERSEPEAGAQHIRALTARLTALPEVEEAHMARAVELTVISAQGIPVQVPGYQPAAGELPRIHYNSVTPGYLRMLGIRLLRGRGLTPADSADATPVAVINGTFAERFWPDQPAIGRQFTAGEQTFEVIGVTANVKTRDIDDPPMPYFWTSLYQDFTPSLAVLLKGRANAEAMLPLLRQEVEVAEGEVTLVPPTPLAQMMELQYLPLRTASALFGTGGIFGLILAVLGIYGIISFAVTQRTREVAIRIALGAQRSKVVRAIVHEGAMLTLIGLAVGLAIVLPLARLVRSQLFGMSPLDPLAVGGGVGVLLLAALMASLVPARRATEIDPIRALREE